MDRGELEAQYLGAGRGHTRGFTRVWSTLHAHDMLHMYADYLRDSVAVFAKCWRNLP